jgi:hypothetical protein
MTYGPAFTPRVSIPIAELISSNESEVNAALIPHIEDRWVLASNLQKAVRRGHSDVAVGTAIKLLSLDTKYFWRRLLVIGYEDVGFGDINLLHTLLKTFRREAFHRQFGVNKVAAYFAHGLASATKSRSLCDGIAMVEFNIRREELEQQSALMSEIQLVDAICNDEEPPVNRFSYLRHICGYKDQAHGRFHTLAPAQPMVMREICRQLKLTEMEATLFLSGQGISESLNIPIPVVARMAHRAHGQIQTKPISMEGKNGILYSALDRHTRLGKKCFLRFSREVEAVASYFRHHPLLEPVTALGVAVFIIEGACLNRWVTFPGASPLRVAFEEAFLEHCGVTGDAASELLCIVRENLNELNRIRAAAIDAAYP